MNAAFTWSINALALPLLSSEVFASPLRLPILSNCSGYIVDFLWFLVHCVDGDQLQLL